MPISPFRLSLILIGILVCQWGQNSIIARFDPVAGVKASKGVSDKIVIIGELLFPSTLPLDLL